MDPANVELVRGIMPPDGTDLTEAFSGSVSVDPGGLVADHATVRFVGPDTESTWSGPQGFFQSWTDWLEPWENYRIYYDDVIERGDHVIALVRLEGITKRGGVAMSQEAAGVFRFDGDRVVALEFHLERDTALAG